MKKIVSVLSVAALTLSAVFAADVSLKFNMKGTLYEETNTKSVEPGKEDDIKQTRSILNQSGYADAESDLVITAKNDFAGFVLDVQPNATTKAAFSASNLKEYYAWMNFGNLQLTTGKWKSRYTQLLDTYQGEWEDDDFMRYPLGVVGGKIAYDVDNLTGEVTADGTKKAGNSQIVVKYKTEQRVSTALAYTIRPNDDTYFMLKGVAVDHTKAKNGTKYWGGTGKWDSDKKYADGEYDITFFSGFAAEAALHTAAFDFNVAAKSFNRNELALGAFLAPKMGASTLLFGFTAGLNLEDNGDTVDHNYREFGIDFRGIFKLSDALSITTMNNLSVIDNQKAKNVDYNDNIFHLWDMVSFGYKANDKVLAQLTVEGECDLLRNYQDPADAKKEKTDNVRDLGGFTLSVIPGIVYSFNENASLTAGFKLEFAEIGASADFKSSKHTTTTKISIPVVFAVAL